MKDASAMPVHMEISDLWAENRVLRLLLGAKQDRPAWRLMIMILVFAIPLGVVFGVAALSGTLMIEGPPVGMLEDYLFLSFSVVIAPTLPVVLRIVVKRFVVFLESIPSFSPPEERVLVGELVRRHISPLLEEPRTARIGKYLLGMIALSTNCHSIYNRIGGWDSQSHMGVFVVAAAYLLFMLVFVLPPVFVKYWIVILCQIRLTRDLVRHNLIVVKPIAPDGSGGLRSLGELSLAFTYFMIPLVVVLLIHYFTWRMITVGFIAGVIGFIPASAFVFFFPLGVVHKAMSEAKRRSLDEISKKYLEVSRGVIATVGSADDRHLLEKKAVIDLLEGLYRRAESMPVWPFNTRTLTQFFAVTLGPVGAIVLELVIRGLMSMALPGE